MTQENLQTLAQAIAHEEGFGNPGERPTRNHNPGDLRDWIGFPRDPGGFSIFPDDATGWEKLTLDLTNHAAKYPAQTLAQFVAGDGAGWPGYAPASDSNDSAGYAAALAAALGCAVETTFEAL